MADSEVIKQQVSEILTTLMIAADMVKPGAVVVDVGINRVVDAAGKARLVGDMAFDSVAEVAGSITPVPGGIGPLTVAMLLHNTVLSYERSDTFFD